MAGITEATVALVLDFPMEVPFAKWKRHLLYQKTKIPALWEHGFLLFVQVALCGKLKPMACLLWAEPQKSHVDFCGMSGLVRRVHQ